MPRPLPRRMIPVLALWAFGVLAAAGSAVAGTVTVFAAASLKTALDEIAAAFTDESGNRVRLVYGGSSALARQLQHGAPANLFLSANAAWMDAVAADGLLAEGTRSDLLTNRLVLIAGAGEEGGALALEAGADLSARLEGGRLAVALVDAVPAGIYARAALQSLGLWDALADRLAQAGSVSGALRLVASGAAPLGIVYATDAAASADVRVLGVFPEDSHPPIRYPVAVLADGDGAQARAFLDFLKGPRAADIFRARGFGLVGDPS